MSGPGEKPTWHLQYCISWWASLSCLDLEMDGKRLYSPLPLKRYLGRRGFGFGFPRSNALLSLPETLATSAIDSFGVPPGPGDVRIDTRLVSSIGSWLEAVMYKLVGMLASTFSADIKQRLRFITVWGGVTRLVGMRPKDGSLELTGFADGIDTSSVYTR